MVKVVNQFLHVRVIAMNDTNIAECVIGALSWKGCDNESYGGVCDSPYAGKCRVNQNEKFLKNNGTGPCGCPCHLDSSKRKPPNG